MRISYIDQNTIVSFLMTIIFDETDTVSIEPKTKYLTISQENTVKECQLREIITNLGKNEMLKISCYSDGDIYTCYIKIFDPPKVEIEYEFDSESGNLIAVPCKQSSRKIYTIVQC